ncbi:NAD-binding protein [Fangia hongkongensis]|uniref:NAD-binding protein n=1 Tax=Fangia hongkongensis TaxID=270495 RepID=UPI00036BB9C0|nr:NAD-binding protein [Fangia hongkongensis]MBK2123844.1 NAD-binding protein [Fangia hongkongensis]
MNKGDFQGKFLSFYIPLILSILICFNALLALILGIIPYIQSAISHTDLNLYANEFIHNSLSHRIFTSFSEESVHDITLKVNTITFLILGYILLLIARGVYRRVRFFWALALIILILLFCNSFFVYANTSVLTWIYAIEIIGLLASWKLFDKRFSKIRLSYAQFVVILSFILALLYGVIGSYLLRDEFQGIKDWSDALYFTVVTYSTVGYGDITPLTEEARLFVVSMIFIGLGAFAGILTFIVGSLVNRIQNLLNVFNKGKKHMKDHIIICGYNTLTQILVTELVHNHTPFLIIDNLSGSNNASSDIKDQIINGLASDPEVLRKANILAAKSIVIAYDHDADNILTLLTLQELLTDSDHKITTVIRINNESNLSKAKKLGADEIVSPYVMAANAILTKANS